MEIVDANIILRYLLKDNNVQYKKACEILEQEVIYIPDLIIAEVVYVLEKVYKVEREEILHVITDLLTYQNIIVEDRNRIQSALLFYKDKNLDFADSILLGYNKENKFKVNTFDKKLDKLLE